MLYYATSLFDYYSYGVYYSRPERYYFWGYYVLMNWFWIMIPGCKLILVCGENYRGRELTCVALDLIYESVEIIADQFRLVDRMNKTLQAKGEDVEEEMKKMK